MDFQLTTTDQRVGRYDEEGALIRPSQMIDGKPYDPNHASFFYVDYAGARYVVAIPVWFTDVYTVTLTAPEAAKPVFKPGKAGTKVMVEDAAKADDDS